MKHQFWHTEWKHVVVVACWPDFFIGFVNVTVVVVNICGCNPDDYHNILINLLDFIIVKFDLCDINIFPVDFCKCIKNLLAFYTSILLQID